MKTDLLLQKIQAKDFFSINEMVSPIDEEMKSKAVQHIKTLTMPEWAMGRLLDLATDLWGIYGKSFPKIEKKMTIVFAGDHGITDQGVSPFPSSVTAQMVSNFVSGGAAVNVLCRQMGSELVIADFGVNSDFTAYIQEHKVLDQKIRGGTRDFSLTEAMTLSECMSALEKGILLGIEYGTKYDICAIGEMGIGNTTASSALMCALLNLNPESVTGRGTGLDNDGLNHKIKVIESALQFHGIAKGNVLQAMQTFSGYEINGMCGFIIGSAIIGNPVIVDGFISGVAALCAFQLCPAIRPYLVFSHCSQEPGHRKILEYLKGEALIDLNLRLGEASGAVLVMPLIESALKLVNEMATFEQAQVDEKIELIME